MSREQKHAGDDNRPDRFARREELAASELRYRRLFESAKDGILILDAETGMIMDVNPFLTDLLGYSRAEFLGKRIWELGFFKQLAANADKFAELQAREYVRYENLPLETVEGLIREVEFVSNVYLAGGKRVIQCNIRDITERKRTEAYREMTTDILRLLNETRAWPEIMEGVVGSLKSHSGCEAVGVRLEDGDDFPYYVQVGFPKEPPRMEHSGHGRNGQGGLCRDATGNACLACTCRLVLAGKTDPDHPLFTRSGSAWTNDSYLLPDHPPGDDPRHTQQNQCMHNGYASVALIPIPGKDRIAGLLQFSDRRKGRFSPESVAALEGIAAHIGSAWMRKQAEASKLALAEQLRHAQKMEAIGRLAGGVAHDFNNALMVIMGNVELCRSHNGSGRPIRELLDQIMNAATRATETSKQLLAFARKQVVKPTLVNLNATVGGMVKLLSRLIGEDIELIWRPGENVWATKIDPAQIDQIMVNLLVNARDAMAGGGRVTLETENVTLGGPGDGGAVGAGPGDYVTIAVSDSGCGMDQATLTHIFEPFFTTKEAGKGTGLGLATVYGVVQQNSGHIQVTSEPGQGTTIKIYLPREVEAVVARTAAESRRNEIGGRGEAILLVEDEDCVRTMCELFLKNAGYTVTAASAPEEALAIIRRADTPFDLLLSDIIMPGMNGLEMAGQMKTIQPELKILFMSGYPSETLAQRELPADAAFLPKPFSRSELTQKVRTVLNAGARGRRAQDKNLPHLVECYS